MDVREVFLFYLDRIFETERWGESREESFYPHLRDLFEWYARHRGWRDLLVTMIPRKTASCLLDFQVRRGEQIVGYVEAKRPGADLDRAADCEQVKRYRKTFPNLLLTNFREIRLYREAEVARVEIGRHDPSRVLEVLDLFAGFDPPPSGSAALLAERLAGRTRILADRIRELLERDTEGTSDLSGFYRAFSEYLLAGLDHPQFADLYAQTLSYGLLAARWQTEGEFDRRTAAESIPATSGILRDVFRYISLASPPPEVGWIVDEIVGLLAAAPVKAMLDRYFRRGRGRDPVLDFYQTFLLFYDRGLRKRRGVYYSPPELVSYVVRSVHHLLVTRLGRRDGLADPGVTLLDPAAGTLTFLVEAIRCAVEAAEAGMGGGGVPALLRDHVLRDFHAFELMMAPYAIGHLKMSLILEEMGRPLQPGERFHLYLTNALEMEDLEQTTLPGMATLSRESREAGKVKKEKRITVVLGNPPWSGHSANRGQRFKGLTQDYYRVEGEPLGERNPKWLQDDYVKFLRFAQRKVEEAGEGIVAFVTSHSYLDNPTFRGMRRSLLDTFDEIYLLDLHGNGKKKERSPDGSADANVFEDVRQGVAVALLVKRPGLSTSQKLVLRADLWGSRAVKRQWLAEHDVATTPWQEIEPRGPAFLFNPRDGLLEEEYRQGIPLPEIFPERSAGIVTGRDAFAICTDPEELRRRIRFLRESSSPGFIPEAPLDTATWKLVGAAESARKDAEWTERFHRILYHPFDWRWVFYADYVLERPRKGVMRHLLAGPNLALVVPRQHKEEPGAFVANGLVAHKAVSAYDINSVFPLYLHPEGRLGTVKPAANLGKDALRLFTAQLGEEPSPELVFQYVYAILCSPPYQRRYAALLRTDFPRIPFPRDRGTFLELSGLGAILINLHLPEPKGLIASPVRFQGRGSDRVEAIREYRPAERRLVMNREGQAFEGIDPEVWDYRVGGYRVLDRWLTGREERALRYPEIEEFRRIAVSVAETIRVQRRLGLLSGVAFQGSAGQACLG